MVQEVPQSFRTALITGASKGIGKTVALRLVGAGYALIVNYRSSMTEADALVRQITDLGGRAHAIKADVSHSGEAARLVRDAEEILGHIDVLINNAGITRDRLLLQMSEADWDATWQTDLVGAREASRAVLPLMRERRSGRIVNVSSVVGPLGNAGQANYAAAKSGLLGLTRELALLAAPYGITVNCIIPGYVRTDATAHLTDAQEQVWIGRIPLGRAGAIEEVADAIVFLAAGPASYVTGQCIAVDGGLLAAAGNGLAS